MRARAGAERWVGEPRAVKVCVLCAVGDRYSQKGSNVGRWRARREQDVAADLQLGAIGRIYDTLESLHVIGEDRAAKYLGQLKHRSFHRRICALHTWRLSISSMQ